MQRHRRLLTTAISAGLGLAAFRPASAQPQPYQDDPPNYRSNRPYAAPRPRTAREAEAERRREGRDARRADANRADATHPEAERSDAGRSRRAERPAEGPGGGRARERAVESLGTSFHSTAAAGGRPGTLRAVAAAQDVAATEGDGPALAVRGGLDLPTQYLFRGYNRAGSGWIVQPHATLAWTAFRNDDFSLTPHGGFWLSWGEEQGDEGPHHFQEFDLDGGVAVGLGDFTMDFQYVYYQSPANLFEDSHEVGVDVTYDDSRSGWGGGLFTGLHPSFALFYQARDDGDDDYNTYVGLGLEPTLKDMQVSRLPVSVSFPLTVGGSYDGYYKDDDGHNANVGFYSVGVKAGVPLGAGGYNVRWALEAELDYVRLLADSAQNANEGDPDDFVFRVGLKFR